MVKASATDHGVRQFCTHSALPTGAGLPRLTTSKWTKCSESLKKMKLLRFYDIIDLSNPASVSCVRFRLPS